jgi:hypothetical protein
MAKKILPLATNFNGYPGTQNNPNGLAGWDFIQGTLQEQIAAIMWQLTGSTASVVMLGGASVTISGGNYSTTAGWIWYKNDANGIGELFFMPTISSTTMGGNSYLNASVSTDSSGADPIIYIGGASLSPHKNRTIILTPAGSASVGSYSAATPALPNGLITILPDATLWVPFNNMQPILVSAFGANFAAGSGLYYYKKPNNEVVVYGDALTTGSASNPGTIFTLPAGYRPAGNRTIGTAMGVYSGSAFVIGYLEVTSAGVVSITTVSGAGSIASNIIWAFSFSPFIAGY